uniref:Uncharacterized protein n=1 Tax=Plectus sambesii TaxID=2011161 RepID=A0A914XSR5_9BILA
HQSPRYVNVADRLPEKSYLFIPPNRTVFRGVELYYDRDSKTFTTEVGRHHSHSSSDSSGSVDGSEDSDDHRFDRETRSEGDAYPSSSSDDDDDSDGEETPLKRPSSCPPFHVLLD